MLVRWIRRMKGARCGTSQRNLYVINTSDATGARAGGNFWTGCVPVHGELPANCTEVNTAHMMGQLEETKLICLSLDMILVEIKGTAECNTECLIFGL